MSSPKRTIEHQIPIQAFSALRLAPEEFAREMRLAACVQWYREGLLSQGKAAEISGLTRAEFLRELGRRHVDAIQLDEHDLDRELDLLNASSR